MTLTPRASSSVPKEGGLSLPYLGSSSDILYGRDGLEDPPTFIKSWIRPMDSWNQWIDKLTPSFENLWNRLGILQLIHISKEKNDYQASLINAALHFWSPSSDCFIFPSGHMTVTLLDVFMLTGLPRMTQSA